MSLLKNKYLPRAEQIKKDKKKFQDDFSKKSLSISNG